MGFQHMEEQSSRVPANGGAFGIRPSVGRRFGKRRTSWIGTGWWKPPHRGV